MTGKGVDIDHGYAWVVLGGAFSIQMIAGILTYSPGVTNIAILEQIENDLDKTSWIGSALFGTFSLLGPVAGIIQTRVGSRITAVSGGVIVLIGMTSAFFCKTITGLILTYGFITGFGICLGGNVVGTVPSQYFVKRRATAYGICISGGAMGLFISGPLTRYLLNQYGINGTLLLLGAIAFHLCATGFLFRKKGPVALQENLLNTDQIPELHQCDEDINARAYMPHEQTNAEDQQEDQEEGKRSLCSISQLSHNDSIEVKYDVDEFFHDDVTDTLNMPSEKSSSEALKGGRSLVSRTREDGSMTSYHLRTETSKSDFFTTNSSEITNEVTTDSIGCEAGICKTLQEDEKRPLNLYTEDESMNTDSKGRVSSLCNDCTNIANLSAFATYNVSVLLWSLGESACMFHLPNYAQSKGSTLSQAASIFQAVGVGGLFSRTVTGLIASDSSIGYTTLHVGLSGIAGTLSLLFPHFSNTFPLQMAFGVLYGLYNQGVNTLMGPITIEMIGLSNISIGYGVVYNSSGVGYFLGPPIASALYRLSGSYDLTFIFTGTCLILSSMTAACSSVIKTNTGSQT